MAFPYLFKLADESQASFRCDGGFASVYVFPQAALECGSCVGYFVTACLSDKLTSADLKTYELLARLTIMVGINGALISQPVGIMVILSDV